MPARLLPLLAALLILGGCSAQATPEPADTTVAADFPRTIDVPASADAPGSDLTLDAPPQRVVALSYEAAEVVVDLGASDRLVMVPKAMTNPALSDQGKVMAAVEHHSPSESSVDAESVIAANPDLVLLSDRRGLGDGVGQMLESAGIPVLIMPNNWATVADMTANIDLIGTALGLDEDAEAMASEIAAGMTAEPVTDRPRVLVLSNQAGRPFVTAGTAFPLEVLRLAGGDDASERLSLPHSGPISAEQVLATEPDAILLVDMNGSGEETFRPLLDNPAVATLPAVAEDRILLVTGREVQALGLADTVDGRDRIADWLAQ